MTTFSVESVPMSYKRAQSDQAFSELQSFTTSESDRCDDLKSNIYDIIQLFKRKPDGCRLFLLVSYLAYSLT
jgi:hypothetical protein